MSQRADTMPASSSTELRQLWHDLRQQLAAGILVAELPDGDGCESLQHRLATLKSLLHSMMQLLEPPSVDRADGWSAPLDLVDLVDECVEVVRLTHGTHVTVAAMAPPGAMVAFADRVMLRRALANVLDNASRAAGPHGNIAVQVEVAEPEACIAVADDGDGFGSIATGSGHGLAIVDRALRDCNGHLEIASGPGPGTTVRLFVPATCTRELA